MNLNAYLFGGPSDGIVTTLPGGPSDEVVCSNHRYVSMGETWWTDAFGHVTGYAYVGDVRG